MRIKIQVGSLELLQFSLKDTRELYCVRNHDSVRRYMSNPEPIPYKSHARWVKAQLLCNRNFLLFLVRTRPQERAVGLTQLRIEGDTAEIGVMFREAFRHQMAAYISTVAMLHLAFEHLQLRWIVSYVIPSHGAAIRFNKSFGAWEEESDIPGMVKVRLSKDRCIQNENFRRVFDRVKHRLHVGTADIASAGLVQA